MKFLLKLTHIELFLLIMTPIGVRIIFNLIEHHPFFDTIINISFFVLFLGWLYSTGNELGRRGGKNLKQLILFRISTIIHFLFIVLISFKDAIAINTENPLFFVAIVLSLISLFYVLYYVSKMLLTEEKQREVSFEEHQIECFLFFVFVVGIWVLQPRINRLV